MFKAKDIQNSKPNCVGPVSAKGFLLVLFESSGLEFLMMGKGW
jgi:hypothetical protein